MTLTHKTKNTWRFDGDTLVLLNRPNGVEIITEAMDWVLDYTWRIGYNHKTGKVQAVATSIPNRGSGSRQISLSLHRLIMENVPHGPEQTEIDHKDGNPLNNRLDNLRYVTTRVNQWNRRDVNGMPLRGISRKTTCWRSRPWYAQIKKVDGTQTGKAFSTAREAEEHYLKLKRQYHPETPEIWFEQYAECQAKGYWG